MVFFLIFNSKTFVYKHIVDFLGLLEGKGIDGVNNQLKAQYKDTILANCKYVNVDNYILTLHFSFGSYFKIIVHYQPWHLLS